MRAKLKKKSSPDFGSLRLGPFYWAKLFFLVSSRGQIHEITPSDKLRRKFTTLLKRTNGELLATPGFKEFLN